MARIPGVDPDALDGPTKAAFDAQRKKWVAPLGSRLTYARRPRG